LNIILITKKGEKNDEINLMDLPKLTSLSGRQLEPDELVFLARESAHVYITFIQILNCVYH
jgi:hypothetical protein